MEKSNKKIIVGLLLVIVLTAVISLKIGKELPTIGAWDTPANGQVSDYYIENAVSETASPNLVTAVLADYRGFDTMFETCVLFLSGMVVCMTLAEEKQDSGRKSKQKKRSLSNLREENKSIFDLTFRIVIPLLIVYAIYVLTHGEVSLGGGFQAGALLACAYLLDWISPGSGMYLPRLRTEVTMRLGAVGVLIYVLTGVLCLVGGGSFLEYGALPFGYEMETELHSNGIFMIEVGVTICVMAVIVQILEIVLERTGFDD